MSRIQRARELLRKAFRWQKAHGHDKTAARIKHAQDDLRPPVHITYPGVQAAREQSREGGLPGIGGPNPGADWCLKMVRMCYGIGPKYLRAIDAWNGARRKHRTSNAFEIPRGYPVYWAPNHIAIAAGKGMCWSTDIKRDGFFDLVPIAKIHEEWGLTLLGWSEDLNGEIVPAEEKHR